MNFSWDYRQSLENVYVLLTLRPSLLGKPAINHPGLFSYLCSLAGTLNAEHSFPDLFQGLGKRQSKSCTI